MTRDYAKKKRTAPARKKVNNPIPWWVWMLTGSALSAFVMFLLYLGALQNSQPQTKPIEQIPEVTQTPPPKKVEKVTENIPKPRFDFYKLLKESEVIVPATESADVNESTIQVQSEYILQVGSFRKATDADKLRAQLILLNLEARTEAVTVRRENWHRVIVGPFNNQSKLAKARSTLVSNRYSALVLKRNLPKD